MAGKRPAAMGPLIDGIWEKREQKRKLAAEIEKIEGEIAAMEEALLARMDQEGIDKSTGKKASVGVSEVISANIKDFDEFAAYVKKTGYFHLFQRRVSDVACRELFEKHGKIPGLEPFKKRKLNVRTLS
jgi:hypothetical protein